MLLGAVNLSGVVEPGRTVPGSGSVSEVYVVAGSFGFVGGQEAKKFDAIVRA